VTRDLVLDDAGAIHGTVVDATGAPVADVVIDARSNRQGEWSSSNIRSDDTGRFHIDAVRAGEYRVTASHGWTDTLKKPGTTDDATQGEKVTVHATQIATVRLLVEAQTGTITGVVTDAKGAPISDAFVAAARESDAAGAQPSSVQSLRWWGEDKPIVTGTDGTFALAKLASPGKYTVRAYRKGGGEAIAEHVATGGRAALRLAPTGSLAGTVTRDGGGNPDEITVSVRDLASGFARDETYYRTRGHYTVRDLPPGHFVVDAKAVDGHLSKELDLAEGEARTGVDFTLVALLTVTGRVVEAGTQTPVAGIMMFAQLARSADMSFNMDSDQQNISGADGRFTLGDVPRGQLQIRGFPREWKDSPYAYAVLIKQLDGSGAIDLGDVPVMKKRVAPGEPIGELGVHFAEQAPGTPPEQIRAVVSYIDPAGPAARSGLVVGDVVIAVDGTDITGTNSALAWNQLNAPPGTTIRLGLERGATVAIVLAAP
jgi:protocatechuate 3,4-dioxygenase beta subunit